MKVDVAIWRRRTATDFAGRVVVVALCVWGAHAAAPLGPSDRPEVYINGSSYIRLARPISLKQLVGLSFRTCVGGELFSQRFEQYTLHVTALYEQVVVQWARPGQPRREAGLPLAALDNRWHWVALRPRAAPPALLLEVDAAALPIANLTWNAELLAPGALEAGGAVLLVGNLFSGCLHEGPQLEFHAPHTQTKGNVTFGHCPLTTDQCKDRKDVLREPPTDHCYAEPCMRHGTCISRHDRYECHCTARYTGNNCEVDAGPPCAAAPCRHGARCVEDARGDYACVCPPPYHGVHCELEVSLDPLCVAGPCRNNGSCSVPPGADTYVCACPPGYTGRNCETDVDECSGAAGAGACLNGGRCVDAVNNFTCDCSGTGYTGVRCEVNVDECLEERVCGPGECYDTYGGFVCACRPPYTGERCHIVSACASGPCGAGGTCVEEGGGAAFRCVCARGWAPPLCAEPLAAPLAAPPAEPEPAPASCAELACPPHSHCRLAHASGVPAMVTGVVISKQVLCVCDVGYYGAAGAAPNCSLAGGACEAGVCLNGAACLQAADHFNCSCAPGYKGAYCEQAAGKALSDLKAPERCSQAPCLHAKTCQDLASGFRCECEAGWAGPRCDAPDPEADCRAARCPPAHECVEQPAPGAAAGAGAAPRWRCVPAGADSPCAGAPCNNGSCLVGEQGLALCQCPPGATGRFCESDIDECQKPKICNNGVCMNVPGSYQCYCKPGYTGDNCDQDVDECLSSPCKNGGTCQNLQNNYECTCMDGFEGKDCSLNIDECAPGPCAAGSTCVDGVAGYSCVCVPGLTGPTCHLNIDDCESQPCQHGGRCTDGLDSYTCDCAGTGYSGAACEANIDECAPQPCRNGGTCQDDVNDYHCSCYPGYTGKNCETDINECESSPCQFGGVCLQRSDAGLYQREGAPPGPPPHVLLPDHFHQPFSYDIASGFVCVCVAGTAGARCEINVDECASSPCAHGACVDGVGAYRCDCLAGYEGERCEIEVDECLRYTPCVHGRCYDGPATYSCECEPGYGGRNCSVPLEGCRGAPCRNHGTCLPWLRDETAHRFNCSCAPGYYGTTCEKITTMSLSKRSYVEVNTSREEGYELSFRFKTTLRSGLLAMGRGLTYFFLELSNGRLNLHSSLLNKWGGVFIGSNLNDTNWQKVFVTINASHLVLAANEEQTIYPISQIEAYNSSVTSFPSTRLGTAGSSYNTFTHGPNFFVGCFQDVVVNKQWVLPEDSSASATEPTTELGALEEGGSGEEVGGGGGAPGGGGSGGGLRAELRAELRGVLASCPRTAQCEPNPCRSGGACEDAWTSFVCSCPRPYLGDTCQYSYTAATFGHESARARSAVRVEVGAAARRAVHAALDISMFIRTRKPTGHIFYLGSVPRYGETDDTLVSAALKGGELLVRLRFNQTPEDYTVGGTRLDNGYLHLIEVVRNATLVQVKLNGTEYFRKSISAAKQLDAQVLYLGGPPPPAAPPTAPPAPAPAPSPAPAPGDAPASPPSPAAPTAAAPPPAPAPPAAEPQPDDADYFKGVIQDVQVSNGVNVTVVEFFPLAATLGLAVPPAFGAVSLDEAGVLRGVRSDDACASAPCHHNATCAVTWNDYQCTCTHGYKGKQCAEVEFCQLQGCPLNSHCRNIDGGYECLSNATFDGVNTTLAYQLRVPPAARARPDAPPAPAPPDSLTITYRSKQGGTLFYAEEVGGGGSWFSVGVFRSQVSVAWRLGGALPDTRRMHRAPPAGAAPPADPAPPADLAPPPAGPAPPPPAPGAADATPPPPPAPLTPAPPPPPAARAADDDLYTHWTTLRFTFADGTMRGAFVEADGHEEPGLATPLDVAAWQRLVLGARLYLGGPPAPSAPAAPTAPTARPTIDNTTEYVFWESTEGDELLTDNVAGKYFKGCMGAVYVGSLLLPFFSEEELFKSSASALITAQPYYAMVGSGRAWGAAQGVGCVLCLEQDCARGGHCADVRSSYACACPPGYAGDYCQIDIDECVDNQCQNGATCRDEVAGYACVCPDGFDGQLCERDIDECASEPCANGGACTDLAGGFRCACGAEWRGARCQLPRTRSCAHQPCAPGRGLCRDVPPEPPTGNNYTCSCFEGFEGVHCEDAFCELQPCLHGDCRTEDNRAECLCAAGYSGRRCEAERDECLEAGPAACAHGGRCLDRTNGYVCDCDATGWTGARCELDVDECAAGLVSCLPGECVNTEGGYTCLCSPGFCGINCALLDPCYDLAPEGAGAAGAGPGAAGARNATGPCQNGARCEQRCAAAVDYQCHCVDGWGGKNCTQQAVSEGAGGAGGGAATTVGIVAGAALLALCAAGGALALLALQARRKRATRGTYSPSGQEYCNPRAEHMHSALKPPPEERLI